MSARIFFTITTGAVLFFTNCNQTEELKKFSADKIRNTPLFHLSQFCTITEGPINSPEVFNRLALKKLGITEIIIYSKGGKNPEDTLQKLTFNYSKNWTKMEFELKEFEENPVLWSKGTIRLNDDKSGSSTFSRYFGIDKKTISEFVSLPDKYLIIKNKNNDRKDSTIYYGSFVSPKAIVKTVGKKILSAELFLASGSSSKTIKQAFSDLNLNAGSLIYADCSVTFTENGKPLESYLLDENCSQVNLMKNWKYDASGRITEYSEWNGSNLLEDITVHYSDEAVPDYFSVNSRIYYIRYN